jgi:glycosyltransferase involved in cell wall biosynthesis
MFETDSIPDGWVSRLNYMDEVWVPTDAQADIFREAGVEDEKLHVVGEGVDTDFYKPTSGLEDAVTAAAADNPMAKVEKPLLDSLRQFRYKGFTLFLFVGKWEERKGVRVLLRAFYQEFGVDERALLLVLTSAYHSSSDFDVQIDTILKEEGLLSDEREGEEEQHKRRKKVLLLNNLSQGAMPQLYSLASALVQPSRGEGWGRPHIECMSCGTPIIATDWSGPTAYLDANNGYPVEVERMESAASAGWNGHQWARPSEASLRQHMRSVHERPDEALEKGRQARKDMLHSFSLEALAGEIAEQLARIARATAVEMRRGEGEL